MSSDAVMHVHFALQYILAWNMHGQANSTVIICTAHDDML